MLKLTKKSNSSLNKSFYEHLNDLRKFFIVSIIIYVIIFISCFYFSQNIYFILSQPLIKILSKYNLPNNLIYTDITEVFITNINIAFNSSLVIFFILFLPLLYIFLIPVFTKLEKKITKIFMILSPILFIIGIIVSYMGSIFIWEFFIKFSFYIENLTFLPSISLYIKNIINIILLFGFIFQIPLLITILYLLKFINEKDILRFSKYIILIAFIIGAVFTPPDPLSQIILAFIIIILYYISYVFIYFIKKLIKEI